MKNHTDTSIDHEAWVLPNNDGLSREGWELR